MNEKDPSSSAPEGEEEQKPQKQKTVWVDDGRSFADMSGVPRGLFRPSSAPKSPSSAREKWETFRAVFRMMLLPTLVAAGALALGYLLLWLAFGTK
jgi:hypothetical protein